MIIDKETARFLVLDHTGHRVRRLTSAAGLLTVPPTPGPSLGTWSVSMGFRLRPPIKRFTFWWEPPTGRFFLGHAIRIDPLGLNQNARWTDLLLVTGLTGQLRKGQFSSHWSTDWCTLNTHRSYRDPVIRVPVRPVPGPGNIGYTGYTGSDQVQPVTPGAPVTPDTPPTLGDSFLGMLL